MQGQFTCPECQAAIVIRFLNPGEACRCKSCGANAIIPETLEQIEESAPPSTPVTTEEPEQPRKDEAMSGHGLRMVHYAAIVANGLYFVLYVVGLSTTGIPQEGLIFVVFYFLLPLGNIAALVLAAQRYENRMIALNIILMLFNLLMINIYDAQEAKLGAFLQLMVTGITAIAFGLGKDESWLSLYLERKRLEEKRKIKALRSEDSQDS